MGNISQNKENFDSLVEEPKEDKKNCESPPNSPKSNTSDINQKLLIALKLKGYPSFSKFGSEVGYTGEYISMIIHRKYKPILKTAEKIARKLGLGVGDIFDVSLDINIPEIDNLLRKRGENEK